MPDATWGRFKGDLASPASSMDAITPHDTNDLANVSRAVYVGVAGDVKVRAVKNGSDVTLKNVAAGAVLPIRVSRIFATGTTASSIVVLY